ncbi:ribulose-phosphate 3-epimerase [Gallalistipes aquisgranensis]|uniref:ribulose-phosphate 3-epimerase n=1 Tax=Gallalistipes aquisgranensis TaxID=2779358 RepID=UPI001CF8358E|nr:ribulose-phosphate 3-epimerase [Gallalistipes aquisgranensis]MBE5033739.1 ribulose-phosphate 3-epimerase [Gallalistipes aquisgranensis]
MNRIISPSMLSADFGHLDRDTRMIDRSRAEWIHIDVMDGVFVPNISFGFPVLKAIDAASDKFMDVHLMIVEPERYVKRFAEAGADLITFHAEATSDPQACIEMIRQAGVKAGISIKPATPVETVEQWLPMLDLVLVMSVEPGFGGQSFIGGSVEKVKRLRSMIDGGGFSTLIEIDGGVGPDNAGMLFAAGCDVLVAGSAIFRSPDPEATIVNMLEAK